MQKRNKVGRPALAPEQRKRSTFSIRLTEAERDQIEAAASAEGFRSASDWARRVLLSASLGHRRPASGTE